MTFLVGNSVREIAMTTAQIAFQIGFEFHSFIHSSHCYDTRDMGRFFCLDMLDVETANTLKAIGEIYNSRVDWTKPKDHGIMVARNAIDEYFGGSTVSQQGPTYGAIRKRYQYLWYDKIVEFFVNNKNTPTTMKKLVEGLSYKRHQIQVVLYGVHCVKFKKKMAGPNTTWCLEDDTYKLAKVQYGQKT